MTSPQLEKIFYHHALSDVELCEIVKPDFFETDFIKNVYRIGQAFLLKYRETPSLKQIYESGKIDGKLESEDRQKLQLLYKFDSNEYDDEWVKRNARGWIELRGLDTSIRDLVTYRKTTKVDIENIGEVVDTARSILSQGTNVTFDFDEGSDFFNPASHLQPVWDTFTTGFPYLDRVLGGGWMTKALYIVAGENKIGKSIWLANFAANAVKEGHNCALATFEMREEHITKRLGANLLNISMDEYGETAKDQDLIRTRLANIGYDSLKVPGKLFIKKYPTSSASTKDLESYLLKMEQRYGFKFKVVFVDYINIMMNWRNPNTENTYMKIKQIAEDLRALGERNNWAMVSLTQINRCLTLDTKVLTENGTKEIGKIKEGDKISSPHGFSVVTKIYPIEKQKVYLVKTKSGKHIKVSKKHLHPTSTGLKTTLDLKIGDKLLVEDIKL